MAEDSNVTTKRPVEQDDYKPFSRWWAVPGMLLAVGVAALVDQVGPSAMGEAAGLCTVPTALVLASCWRHYRRKRWALPFAVTTVLLHVVAIALIPWPTRHEFSKGDLVFVCADLFANYGLMSLFKWLSEGTNLCLWSE